MSRKMLCPKCHKRKATEHRKFGILPCQSCQMKDSKISVKAKPEFYTATQTGRIVQQRDEFAKDILQPFEGKNHKPNRDFVEAYPDIVDDYFEKGDLEKL